MDYREINWDEVPDVISKELFRKLCHVSKRTAKYLLDSGKVPCKNTKQATHKYKISSIIEYQPHIINSWYIKLKDFKNDGALHVPKIYLIEFMNFTYFKAILQKSKWHQMALETYIKNSKHL